MIGEKTGKSAFWRRAAGAPVPARSTLAALVVGLGMLACSTARGETSVQLRIDRNTLSEDDQITVRVVASGEYDEVVPPTSDGFDFDSAGRSSQVSIIGTHMQRSDTYTYIGRPRRQGRWTIGPVILRLRGRQVAKSPAAQVNVTSARAALGQALSPSEAIKPQRYQGEAFFVFPQLSTPRPYAGQPFVLSYQLFWSRRTRVTNIRELSGPKYGGFEVEDLLGGRPQGQEPTRFGGAPYFRQTTRRVLLTAPSAGQYEVLGPRYRVEAGDIFSQRAYKVGPPPIAIEVRDVPSEGRPEGYQDGNVGRLELDGWLLHRDKPVRERKVSVGERVVLHVEVRGSGNLFGIPRIEPPKLPNLRVEPLPGRADEHIKTTAAGTEGKRVWQYMLTFQAGGRYEIPAITFVSFDPYDEAYKTSTAGPFFVQVDGPVAAPATAKKPVVSGKSTTQTPPTTAVPTNPEALKPPATNSADRWQRLAPIAAQARLAQTAVMHWTELPWFWRLASIPWALVLLFGVGRVFAGKRAAGEDGRRREGALALALRQVQTAGTQPSGGYGVLRKATADYLLDKTNLRLGGLTYSQLNDNLTALGVAPAVGESLASALQRCDAMQYAPGAGAADLESLAAEVGKALTDIDAALSARVSGKKAGWAWWIVGSALAASLVATDGRAASVDDAFGAANAAYIKGDYKTAKAAYEDLLRHDLPAAAIHYNLGNVLVRTGRLGEAIGHYKQALRMNPDDALATDIRTNLKLCREELAERSRRRHRILHIFDESPEIDVALARAAPRNLLGVVVLAGGFAVFFLLLIGWWPGRTTAPRTSTKVTLVVALVAHVISGGWLWHAQDVDENVRYVVVVEEDATLGPCTGVGESVDLPEGLEVRQLKKRPDGRVEVRLPNGRSGCMEPSTLYGMS